MIALEDVIPGARSPLKRLRNVVAELMGMQIDEIEKNYKSSRDKVLDFLQFDVPSFGLGVSQEEKEALPKGVVVVNSQANSLVAVVYQMCKHQPILTKVKMHWLKHRKGAERAERATDKETLLAKPAEEGYIKAKAGKEKYEEVVSKKAKRGNSSQQAIEGGESLQKTDVKEVEEDSSVGKVEAKNEGRENKQLTAGCSNGLQQQPLKYKKDGRRFTVTPFDAYVILGVPFGGRKIIESNRPSTNEEYNEVQAA
ncbi:hypothetical protein Cgig2_017106 [Carnegiea gigantea]|uniref:Uncharacterized protein n=1 Tax=Carnegiea gigantea TaxID=171969 RepID=A0A9Q1GU71_9CARY|nr:hypothetical protein Cgig2_017106 [Carnegiea gigantea]